MRRAIFIASSILALIGCRSVTQRQDFIGTYFRVATVHDEPSGKLVLSEDGRYSFLSVLSGTIDSATGAPFYSEEFGSWTVVPTAIILHTEGGEEKKLIVRQSTPQIELEWNTSVRLRKEPNQPSQPMPLTRHG